MLLRKDIFRDLLLATFFGVVTFLVLGLIRISVSLFVVSKPQMSIVDLPQPIEIPEPRIGVDIVASVNGIKYYLPGCSGAERIKKENLVSFFDEASAIGAGYTIASACR